MDESLSLTLLLYALVTVAVLFAGWRAWRRHRYFLHLFQLEGYKLPAYRRWVSSRWRLVLVRRSHLVGLGLLVMAALSFRAGLLAWTAGGVLAGWCVAFASSKLYRNDRAKKPLAYTSRLQRLLVLTTLIALGPVTAGAVIGLRMESLMGLWPFLAGFWLTDFGAPLWVMLAATLLKPVERSIQRGFKRQARALLRKRPDLLIVGITGSYGKTSTKFIIEEILKQRYNVLATPGSYNTPMGLCLVINTMLRPEHQVLVLEYGIRHPGDMEELLEIARPDVAVVTTVGVAHLETMGSAEAIGQEKGGLVAGLRAGGTAVLNLDNALTAQMADRTEGPVWTVALEQTDEAQITARGIRYSPQGASFDVTDEENSTTTFQTRLLGRHNVSNLLLGIAVGRVLGLRLRQIAHAVRRIEAPAHRLRLRDDQGVTIIDDAFNSNPVGAKNAVEILGQFDSGRRVIVTPGMIELGARQHEENRKLGHHIAETLTQDGDLAVLIGARQTMPIQEGLHRAEFPEERLHIFDSLFDAQDYLATYLRPGDVVLYENDLPDQFNE
ncbi:MAG: UDP-N-acetylmuramoyl-tripeptide--D-alanyl-D-alanine ligase [Bacteroidota bacterium]